MVLAAFGDSEDEDNTDPELGAAAAEDALSHHAPPDAEGLPHHAAPSIAGLDMRKVMHAAGRPDCVEYCTTQLSLRIQSTAFSPVSDVDKKPGEPISNEKRTTFPSLEQKCSLTALRELSRMRKLLNSSQYSPMWVFVCVAHRSLTYVPLYTFIQ